MNKEEITAEVLTAFQLPEAGLKELAPYGSGHINDTFRVTYETEKGQRRYILQRMNKNIFEKPVELMENIVHVTEWIKKKAIENGGERDSDCRICKGRKALPCGRRGPVLESVPFRRGNHKLR